MDDSLWVSFDLVLQVGPGMLDNFHINRRPGQTHRSASTFSNAPNFRFPILTLMLLA